MSPKEKVKRIMTPEQLEKLALARVKAGEARTNSRARDTERERDAEQKL